MTLRATHTRTIPAGIVTLYTIHFLYTKSRNASWLNASHPSRARMLRTRAAEHQTIEVQNRRFDDLPSRETARLSLRKAIKTRSFLMPARQAEAPICAAANDNKLFTLPSNWARTATLQTQIGMHKQWSTLMKSWRQSSRKCSAGMPAKKNSIKPSGKSLEVSAASSPNIPDMPTITL